MLVLRRTKAEKPMRAFEKRSFLVLDLFLILVSCGCAVVSFESNAAVQDIFLHGSVADTSAVADKPAPTCSCQNQECLAEGTYFKVIQAPHSSCQSSVADLADKNLCPSGWRTAAISSAAQLRALVDCLLCGTATEFASSLVKFPVLTSGRVLISSDDMPPLPPRGALCRSGVWAGYSGRAMEIDASIPFEVLAYFDDHPSGPSEPVPLGPYMVFLEGDRQVQCAQEYVDGSAHYSTYHVWTLYSYSTMCGRVGADMYILCQKYGNPTTTTRTPPTTGTTTSTTSTTTSTASTTPSTVSTTPSTISTTPSTAPTTATTIKTTSTTKDTTTTTRRTTPTTPPASPPPVDTTTRATSTTSVVPPNKCCMLSPVCNNSAYVVAVHRNLCNQPTGDQRTQCGNNRRSNHQRGNDRPGGNQSGNNRRGENQGGNNRRGNNQRSNHQRGNNRRGNNQGGNNRRGNNQGGNNQRGNNQGGNNRRGNNHLYAYDGNNTQPRDSVPCSREADEDIIVCPGDEVVIACHTDYVGNITVTCDEHTLALVTSSNTCTLAWIGDVHEMIMNGSFSGAEIAAEINDNVDNKTMTMNDLWALTEELAALEALEVSQLQEVEGEVERVQAALNYTQELLCAISSLLATNSTWDNLESDEAAAVGPEFLASAERSGFLLADQVLLPPAPDNTTDDMRLFNIICPVASMVVTVASRHHDGALSLTCTSASNRTQVQLLPGFADGVADDGSSLLRVVVLFVLGWAARHPLPGPCNELPEGGRRDVNSEVASVSVGSPDASIHFSPPTGVRVHFLYTDQEVGPPYAQLHHPRGPGDLSTPVLHSGRCVFWDTEHSQWSDAGCWMEAGARDEGACRCSHLTMIAVITDVHDYVGRDKALDILGSVVVSVSLLSLLLAIAIFHLSRLRSLRVRITKQLCFALGVSQLLLMLLLDPYLLHLTQKECEAAGAILHFVTLSALFWMLCEGLHLLQVLRNDMDTHNKHFFAIFWFMSYGGSAVIVLTTVAVAVSSEKSVSAAYAGADTEYCWLNVSEGYIWAFTGPLVAVLVVNFVAHMCALYSASSLTINRRRSVPRRIKVWIKGSASLSAILGLTWVFGLMYMTTSHAMAYVFTILTGSQGVFILTFHCFANAGVMTAFLNSFPGRLAMKLAKLVKTSQNSRYGKQSPSVSPDSSIRTAFGKGKVNEGSGPSQGSENLKARPKGCLQNSGRRPKPQLEVHFSSSSFSSAQRGADGCGAWGGQGSRAEVRRFSVASRGTNVSVLTAGSSRRSSSTSASSVASLAFSCTSDYASDSAGQRSPDSVFVIGDDPLPTLFEYDFKT